MLFGQWLFLRFLRFYKLDLMIIKLSSLQLIIKKR